MYPPRMAYSSVAKLIWSDNQRQSTFYLVMEELQNTLTSLKMPAKFLKRNTQVYDILERVLQVQGASASASNESRKT